MSTATGGVVDYATAINGLSLNQAKLLLNMQKVDKQKQNSLLLDAGLISSSERMHAKHVEEALATTNLADAKKKYILNNLNLFDLDSNKLNLSGKCTEAALREELATTALTAAEQDAVVTKILGTSANAGYAISWDALTASIWEAVKATWAFLTTNPVGQIMLAVGVVAALTAGYDALINRKENLARQKLENINEDLDSINEELSSLEELHSKLETAKGDKSELAKIQNELNDAIGKTTGLLNGEENAYELANAKLKANIELKKQQKEQLEQSKINTSKELFDNNTHKRDFAGIDFLSPDQTAANMRKYAKKYNKNYNTYLAKGYDESTAGKKAIKTIYAEDAGFLTAEFSEKEWVTYWNEQVQIAYDAFSSAIENYNGIGGQDFVKNLIDTMVRSGSDFSEISNAVYRVVNNRELHDNVNKYWESLTNPNINSNETLKEINKIVDGIKKQYPELENFFDDFYEQIITTSDFMIDTLSDDADSIEKSLNKVEGSFESVSKAFESENAGKVYDSMVDYLEKTVDLYEKGLWGTDDFKETVQWMYPEDISIDNTEAYKQAFEKTYPMIKNWFNSEDPTEAMWAFVDDLDAKAPGLLSGIDKESGKLSFHLKNSAEAADALGVNVRVVDAVFRKLEEHGFKFTDEFFSGEMVDKYNSAINALKETTNTLSDKNTRKRFSALIETFGNDLDNITEDRIINIEFQISQAELIKEAERIEKQIRESGGSTEQYGALNYNKGEILSGYEEKSEFNENDTQYQSAKEKITDLQEQLISAKNDEEKMDIQKQISVLYDLLIDFQQAHGNDKNATLKNYLQTDANGIIEEMIKTNEDSTIEAVQTLLQSAFGDSLENLDIKDTYKKYISEKLEELRKKPGTLTFIADVEGVERQIQAVSDGTGNIQFTTLIDGVVTTLSDFDQITIDPKTGLISLEVEINDKDKDTETKGGIKAWWQGVVNFFKGNSAKATVEVSTTTNATNNASIPQQYQNQEAPKQYKGKGSANGTAHSFGTATSLWNNYRESTGQAYGGGHWGLYNNERALINELGSEIIVRNGKWFTVNNGYPAFANLKKGDIIFNHRQSEALLKNGYITGSHAKMIGNAYSNGTSSLSSTENSEEFNWIETILSRIQRTISNFGKTVSATWKSWTDRTNALNNQISSVNREIDLQYQARARYEQQANSVALDENTKRLVREGAIDITTVDVNTANLIKEYQEWYEKILECDDAIIDLKDDLADLAQTKFDNLSKQFEDQAAFIDHEASMLEATADLLETRGYIASKSVYNSLIQNTQSKKDILQSQRSALMDNLNNSGIEKGTEAWNKMYLEILDLDEEILKLDNDTADYQNRLRELDWEVFDIIQEKISGITDETEFLIDLMSNDKMFNEDGSATKQGQATLGLHAMNYEVYMRQADDYAKELQKIDAELANDPNNQKLQEHKQELIELWRESALAAEDEKQSAKDLVSEGYDTLLDSMSKIIDKRKEMLSQVKDLYDYEKSIAEQTAEVSKYQKIINSMQGMADTEEGQAMLQKYELSLKEAKENLEETEYDKYISDQERLLDNLYDEAEEWLNQRLDNLDTIISEVINSTNENASKIEETLKTEVGDVGGTLTAEMESIWNTENGSSVISKYSEQFEDKMTTVNKTLEAIKNFVEQMAKESDKAANETISTATPSTPAASPAAPASPPPAQAPAPKSITIGGQINAGGASIYTQAGGTKGYSQYFKKDPIYTVVGEKNGYLLVRHHSLSNGYTGWFRKSDVTAYKTGGLVNETGFAWLDGTKENPEMVLNAKDTENFIALRDALSNLAQNNMFHMIHSNSKLPSFTPNAANQNVTAYNGDVHIELPNINNAQEFAEQFKEIYDKNVGKTRTMLQTDMFSKNNLEYRRYL